MSYQALLALSVYAFVTSISPGPSNFMLLASGANFGFVRTLPQMLGITVGFKLLLWRRLRAWRGLYSRHCTSLKIAGGGYLLYLPAHRQRRSLGKDRTPLAADVLQSAAFQWINEGLGWR